MKGNGYLPRARTEPTAQRESISKGERGLRTAWVMQLEREVGQVTDEELLELLLG